MTQESFELECDRLSNTVDRVQFERLRWSRTEGPMLARLVELAHSAIEARPDFDLVEEGSVSDIKRFVLKVHSMRVVAIVIGLEGGQAIMGVETIDRSNHRLQEGLPIAADYSVVNEQWMASVLQTLFGRIQ